MAYHGYPGWEIDCGADPADLDPRGYDQCRRCGCNAEGVYSDDPGRDFLCNACLADDLAETDVHLGETPVDDDLPF